MTDAPLILYRAAAVRDAAGVNARPGVVAARAGRIVAAGDPTEVRRIAGNPDRTIDLPDALLLPRLVNAHAHLDLTDLRPRPYHGDFIGFVEMVMRDRPRDEAAITRAVHHGLRLAREAGTGLLGDIAGSAAAVRARIHAAPDDWITGTSWLECFGLGDSAEATAAQAVLLATQLGGEAQTPGMQRVAIDLQPHAPYSAGTRLYDAADNRFIGFPSTHLAETPAELQFIRDATGPFAQLLRRLGKWDDSIKPTGLTPVAFLRNQLHSGNWTIAHCNYVTDDDIAILKSASVTVAYCPIASEYFQHRNHRYRDMLAAGVNVCLGTDSIVCQPAAAQEPQPMGILPQMRRLYHRDRTDPATLLRMATINGISPALHKRHATLAPGQCGEFLAVQFDPSDSVDPLTQVLAGREVARSI